MRLFLVTTVGLLVVFAPTQSANARAGRALGLTRIVKAGGPAQTTGAKPSAVPQAATATRRHPMIIVPVRVPRPRDTSEPVRDGQSDAPVGARGLTTPAGGAPVAELKPAPRAWCEDGKVSGGLCVLN